MNPDHPYVAAGMAFAFFLAAAFSGVSAFFGLNEPIAIAGGFFTAGCLSMWLVYRGARKQKNSSSEEGS